MLNDEAASAMARGLVEDRAEVLAEIEKEHRRGIRAARRKKDKTERKRAMKDAHTEHALLIAEVAHIDRMRERKAHMLR
ncbi:hypothetical protein C8Q77DRAFT_1138992 [Trametes polyzona]|nr:hypothetical protein C8Q77DRAFT_1138992 [Trametes polyzona]